MSSSPIFRDGPSLPVAGPCHLPQYCQDLRSEIEQLEVRLTAVATERQTKLKGILYCKIEQLEVSLTPVATERQAQLQEIQHDQSGPDYIESVRSILRTIREAQTRLDANEVQAAIEQIMRHSTSANEIQLDMYKQVAMLQQRAQVVYEEVLREEREEREEVLREEHEEVLREELEEREEAMNVHLHREHEAHLRRNLAAARSSLPVRYGDSYDKLVGTASNFMPPGPLYDVLYPDPPPPDSRRQFLNMSDRMLVQSRQARALAGLDTGLMDAEIAYRVCNAPEEWGRVGSIISRSFETVQESSG